MGQERNHNENQEIFSNWLASSVPYHSLGNVWKRKFKKEVLMITQGIGDIDLTEFLSHGRENLNQNITVLLYWFQKIKS